jgi:hypothetical protein
VRDVYLADTCRQARTLLDKTIAGGLGDDVPEIVSLGRRKACIPRKCRRQDYLDL